MTESAKPLFRIGGWYHRQDGMLVKLVPIDDGDRVLWEERRPGNTFALALQDGIDYEAVGYICLENGRYCGGMDLAEHRQHLLPGELTLRDGEWVPVEDKQADDGGFSEYLDGCLTQPAHVSHVTDKDEPRPALDWNKPTPFDNFDGFTVTSGTSKASTGPLHALQRIAAERSPLCGSAALLVVG